MSAAKKGSETGAKTGAKTDAAPRGRRINPGDVVEIEILCELHEMRVVGDDEGSELQLSLIGEAQFHVERADGGRERIQSGDTAALSLESVSDAPGRDLGIHYERPVDKSRPVHVFVVKAAKEDLFFVSNLLRGTKTVKCSATFPRSEFQRAKQPRGLSWIVEGAV